MFSGCEQVELPVAPTNRKPVASPVASRAPDCARHVHPRENRLVLCGKQSVRQSVVRPLDSWFAYRHFLSCVHVVPSNDRMIKNYEFKTYENETMARYFKTYIQSFIAN